jgi:glycosyltransferase involved in cell wall biosynthesis
MIRKENGGAASAHNVGNAAATGDFIATLDADDAFHPRRLEALAKLACARPDLDLITTETRFVVGGEPVGTFGAHTPFALEDQRTAILRSCFVGGWPAVRLSRLREIGGFDESLRIGHDWDCWLRLILDGSQAGLVTAPYYDYVLHAGALTSSRVASLWDRVRLLEKATSNPALLPAERPLLLRSIREHRTRAARAEVSAALLDTRSGSHLGRLALTRGIDAHTRMLAAMGLIVPPLARRLVVPDEPPEARFTSS